MKNNKSLWAPEVRPSDRTLALTLSSNGMRLTCNFYGKQKIVSALKYKNCAIGAYRNDKTDTTVVRDYRTKLTVAYKDDGKAVGVTENTLPKYIDWGQGGELSPTGIVNVADDEIVLLLKKGLSLPESDDWKTLCDNAVVYAPFCLKEHENILFDPVADFGDCFLWANNFLWVNNVSYRQTYSAALIYGRDAYFDDLLEGTRDLRVVSWDSKCRMLIHAIDSTPAYIDDTSSCFTSAD